MRTLIELKKAIKKLQAERKSLPHYSMFGTNNYGSIDTYAIVLTNAIERKLSESQVREILDNILEEYGGDFPPEETSDYWKVTALDYILEQREDI